MYTCLDLPICNNTIVRYRKLNDQNIYLNFEKRDFVSTDNNHPLVFQEIVHDVHQ